MYYGINPCNHSIILLSFKFIMNVRISTYQNCSIITRNCCLWDKASIEDIANYNNALNRFLGNIDLDCELFTCTNCNCSLDTHKRSIDQLCNFIIHSCISASEKCKPMGATGARPVPGWKDQVNPEREQSLFWHWMWLEAGKPNVVYIFDIMKRTRHQYHYAVRRCKYNRINIQKQKLAENISDSKQF